MTYVGDGSTIPALALLFQTRYTALLVVMNSGCSTEQSTSALHAERSSAEIVQQKTTNQHEWDSGR